MPGFARHGRVDPPGPATTVNQRLQRLSTRPTWGAVFGVVPDRGLRRRPSEVARILLGALVVAVGGLRARRLSPLEDIVHDFVVALPSAIVDALSVINGAGVLVGGPGRARSPRWRPVACGSSAAWPSPPWRRC